MQEKEITTNELAVMIKAGFDDMGERFQAVDQRFTQVDQRFDQIDQRFTQVDQRFDQIDQRFLGVDGKFSELEEGLTDRINIIDNKLNKALMIDNAGIEKRVTRLEKAVFNE